MDLLDYDSEGASFQLDQRELLMLMALVQEGRDSFDCNGETGRELDKLFSAANVLVERSRREALGIKPLNHRMGQVVTPDSEEDAKKVAH